MLLNIFLRSKMSYMIKLEKHPSKLRWVKAGFNWRICVVAILIIANGPIDFFTLSDGSHLDIGNRKLNKQ